MRRIRTGQAGSIPESLSAGAAGPSQIRILIVDDHPVVRQGLASCLADYNHLVIVGEAGNGKEAILKANALQPDVVLMDIEMPKMDGLSATEVLTRENPRSNVLIVSVHKDSEYLLRMSRVGARGYVSKDASPAELVHAIETVGAGGTFYSSTIAPMVLRQILKPEQGGTKQLSPRERQVLAAIAEGLSNKEIASRMNLSVRTIETHRERIMRKLNIHSVAGLTRSAIAMGLIALPADQTAADATELPS